MMNEDGEEANPVLIYTSTFELRGVFVARRVESYSANTRGTTKLGQTKLSPSSLALGLGLVDLWTKRPTKTRESTASLLLHPAPYRDCTQCNPP